MWIMAVLLACVILGVSGAPVAQAEYLGDLSANPFSSNSLANHTARARPLLRVARSTLMGRMGIRSAIGQPPIRFATEAPRLYDREGNYRGRLSANPYDPDSTSNPFGRYGNPFSSESVNNPFGAGNPFRSDSPTNPFGTGWSVIGE